MGYTNQTLAMAVSAVKEGGFSIRRAANIYNVPFTTLQGHVTGARLSTRRGPRLTLSDNSEKELVTVISVMNKYAQGLSRSEVKELASQISDMEVEKGLSDKKFLSDGPSNMWLKRFKERNDLNFRQPMNISMQRMKMETQEVKDEFYGALKKVYDDLCPQGLTADCIYNLDEAGLCLVLKSDKVVVPQTEKYVRSRQSGERGENITVLAAHNATGSNILPPMIIYRGSSINEDLTKDALPGTMFACSPKSFIDSELFEMYFDRFCELLPPKHPVLLIYDGHLSHGTLKTIRKARENGIVILCLPPHTTHIYQPLDRCVLGMLKLEFRKSARALKRKNKIKALNRYHFNQVFTPAWLKACTPMNIIAGFKRTGIWPWNPDAVQLPGDGVRQDVENLRPVEAAQGEGSSAQAVRSPQAGGSGIPQEDGRGTPQPDENREPMGDVTNQQHAATSPESPVVEVIRSFLAPDETTPRARSKNVSKTRILTSDEFIKEVEEKQRQKEEKEKQKKEKEKQRKEKCKEKQQRPSQANKEKKKAAENMRQKAPKEKQKAVVEKQKPGEENPQAGGSGVKRATKLQKKKQPPQKKRLVQEEGESEASSIDDNLSEEEDELCGTCGKSFQKDFAGEEWIKCSDCQVWYHMNCQGLTPDKFSLDFKCDDCVPLK